MIVLEGAIPAQLHCIEYPLAGASNQNLTCATVAFAEGACRKWAVSGMAAFGKPGRFASLSFRGVPEFEPAGDRND